MDKENLRKRLRIARSALNKSGILRRSILVSDKISKFTKQYRYIASYCPFQNELNPNIHIKGKVLYFPKVFNNNMVFKKGNSFKKGYKGIKEPFGLNSVALFKKKIDALIVPALGYDARGYRLGYGMGFYDRFLKNFKGIKIGVTYDCCVVEKINNEEHDVPVDIVLTETKNIRCKLRR